MGLASGPHGIKTFVKTKFPEALRDFPTLAHVVAGSGHRADQAAVLLDGNVLINQIPTAVTDFEGYVRVFGGFVSAALAAADHVLVVWDDPALVSRAKLDEQRRRDLARARTAVVVSADLQPTLAPADDDYGIDAIQRCNPHDLLANRKARPRFYDAICKEVMANLMTRSANASKTLTFDGIDRRGASRPRDEERTPGMFSNVDKLETLLTRGADAPKIGEGDLKLTDLCSEIQHLRNERKYFLGVEVLVVSTIDTDSIAIELMHESAKRDAAVASADADMTIGESIKCILCFRETSGKRKSGAKDGDDGDANGGTDSTPQTLFSCFDLEILHTLVMQALFGSPESAVANDHLHRAASALLACGWALCGCDFCHLKGMRSDAVWAAMCTICTKERKLLRRMCPVWELTRASTEAELKEGRLELCACIKRMVDLSIAKLGELPRMKRAENSAKLADASDYKRAAWCALYWGGLERTDLDNWGFGVA